MERVTRTCPERERTSTHRSEPLRRKLIRGRPRRGTSTGTVRCACRTRPQHGDPIARRRRSRDDQAGMRLPSSSRYTDNMPAAVASQEKRNERRTPASPMRRRARGSPRIARIRSAWSPVRRRGRGHRSPRRGPRSRRPRRTDPRDPRRPARAPAHGRRRRPSLAALLVGRHCRRHVVGVSRAARRPHPRLTLRRNGSGRCVQGCSRSGHVLVTLSITRSTGAYVS